MRLLAAVALAALLAGCASHPSPAPAATPAATAPEGQVATGRLTAAQASLSVPVTVKEGHARLAVLVAMQTNLPQDALVLNVSGPGGRSDEVRVTPELYVLPSNAPVVAFDAPAAGTWTVTLRLASGALADYELDWCADDATHPGPADNKACHRTYPE